MSIRVVSNKLKPAASEEEFKLHCAALEWSLAEPIIINSARDIKSSVDWKDRLEPFHHQVQNLMRFCRRLPVTLLADDVGLGKTISAGLIVAELMKRNRVSKAFVICPKILIPQWVEELDAKFGISAYGAVGSELKAAHNRTESVIVTTYQSATGFLQRPDSAGRFDMLILDEAHKVRNLHGTKQPPKMATAIFKALESRMFKYVVMLTATPIQNRLWDIYSLVDCLAVARGHKNPFGDPHTFGQRFIADGVTTARQLNPETAKEFREIVNSYMFRTRRIDAQLSFPDRQVQTNAVNPTPEELHLQHLIADNISGFNGLVQTSLLVALMSSPQALAAQLENMADRGTASRQLANDVRDTVRRISMPAKANAVLRIAQSLRSKQEDWRMVIFTTRKETQSMLGEVLQSAGVACGFISGGKPAANFSTVKGFREETPSINVIISTDAGAEGVNLQAANILVNYDLPWNPMIVEQRIGRVQRIGSKFKNVWVANIVHKNSPEQNIVVRLMEKLQVISHTVGDIEAVLEATNDSAGESMEKQIREMVIRSLQGQDQTKAAEAAERSIEQAKRLIEEHQEEMDRTLGNADDHAEPEIPMPRLHPALPSMPLRDFVLGALKSEGAKVSESNNGLFSCESDHHDGEFTFDEKVVERASQKGVFMGRAPLLYQQGKRDFERLVQRWIDRGGANVADRRWSMEDLESVAKTWLSKYVGANITKVEKLKRVERFKGNVFCRTRIANAVDSYEKLIDLPYQADSQAPGESTDLNRPISAKELLSDLEQFIVRRVSADSDITKFRSFYESRLKVELERSDSGERKTKLVNDLGPSITADASAISGSIIDKVLLAVTYDFGGAQSYRSEVVAQSGKIVKEPESHPCHLTEQLLPVDCLEQCDATGNMVLREILKRSEESGKLAIPDAFVTCESTGMEVHAGEIETCSITGKKVCRSQLVESDISGRFALREYESRCDVTGATLINDEVKKSAISNLSFRADQAVQLADGESNAHQSEATCCAYSANWHAKADCDVSDITGKPVGKDRLAYSEQSNRKCDISELAQCQETGMRLLADEVGMCAISGKAVRSDLLRTCPETNAVALDTHFEACQVTGERVLPDALETCCISDRRARRSLLSSSEVSQMRCLSDRLVKCQATGIRLLPTEAQQCEATGSVVDARLLKKCEVSGKAALGDRLVQSRASGKWMLPEHARELPNGMVVGAMEIAVCTWTRKYIRSEQIAVCKLCGLSFERNLMNASGEFSLLRECLDGKRKGSNFPDPGFLDRIQPAVFGGVVMFKWVTSTSQKTHIMYGKKSMLGFNTKVFAVIAEGDQRGLTLKGKAVFGKRSRGIWRETESHSLEA